MTEVAKHPRMLVSLLLEALDKTPDGCAIFSPDDRVVYANSNYAALFSDRPESLVGKTFSQASLQAYQSPDGLNIETTDIDSWIENALSNRRQHHFRSFQTDTKNGRWLQLTEQMLEDGHMLVYFTDITSQKSTELQLQRLTEKLRYHAETDDLTGTNNRRHFMTRSIQELRRCRRENKPSALLAIDIDHFKTINDKFGHPGGDQVLITLVQVLNQILRPYDVLGRIGGEEFAVFIPGADIAMAGLVSERLRLAVEEHPFHYNNQSIDLTISTGLVTDDGVQNLESLFKQADRALYQAKHNGRNQVQAYR